MTLQYKDNIFILSGKIICTSLETEKKKLPDAHFSFFFLNLYTEKYVFTCGQCTSYINCIYKFAKLVGNDCL